MGPRTRSGRYFSRLLSLLTFTLCATYAQTSPVGGLCALTSSPVQVRAEGLTERVGNLTLACSGLNPAASVSGTLIVSLPIAITNRLESGNQTTDVIVSADLGSGYVPLPVTAQITNQTILFNGINFAVPASGAFSLQISNLRVAAYQLGASGSAPQPISAQISFPVPMSQTAALVAIAQPGLLATLYDQGEITCTGSPLPSTLTVPNLFAEGTNFASARLTGGFAGAFQPKGTGDDTGTRFLIQYSGFPTGAQLYVPTMVAGSDAAVPTSGGDMGLPQAPGTYVPGSGTLLLVLVPYADQTGAGGQPVSAPTGSGPIQLNSVSPVSLTNGSGYVVYEVVDASASRLESAQVPTFIGLTNVTAPATANEAVSFAPISTVAAASATAPIPRFEQVTPASDCSLLGDCDASYFPHLSVDWTGTVQLAGVAGGPLTVPAYIPVTNTGGGTMQWTATAQYTNGSGWLLLEIDTGTLRIFAVPKALAMGTYQANVIVDAGPLAGSVTLPVTLVVSPAASGSGAGTSSGSGSGSGSGTGANSGSGSGSGSSTPPTTPVVTISQILNAATLQSTPLVAGSLGTVMGSNLNGKVVSITLNGLSATILYSSATQINFQVPTGLAGQNSASMLVTVDGNSSAPQTVILAATWPAIFSGGVLNQDYSVNSAGSAAPPGSIVSIWATGIPSGATVSATLGNRSNLVPLYAGPAPDVTGVQQVNVEIPSDMAAGTVPLSICASINSATACSPAYSVTVGQ
jgi:uncharacterized protein (TIGR03437 family)